MTDPPAGSSDKGTPAEKIFIASDDTAEPSPDPLRRRRSISDRWRNARANHVSKWDRPPPPKDWRYFVGGFGKVLITIGLLMFGFVAYQLWGTGIETARAQNRLEDQFEQAIEQQQVTTTSPAAATTAPADTTLPATTTPPTVARRHRQPPPSPRPSRPRRDGARDGARVDSRPGAAGDDGARCRPGRSRRSRPAKCSPSSRSPRSERAATVPCTWCPACAVNDLKKGPGHYPDTPLPGQLGNSAIAGHRTTYGEPFSDLPDLEPGDEIRITMLTGDEFVYVVTGSEVVRPSEYDVVTTATPTSPP